MRFKVGDYFYFSRDRETIVGQVNRIDNKIIYYNAIYENGVVDSPSSWFVINCPVYNHSTVRKKAIGFKLLRLIEE